MKKILLAFLLLSCAPIQRDFEIKTSLTSTLVEVGKVCLNYDIKEFYETNGVHYVRVVCR